MTQSAPSSGLRHLEAFLADHPAILHVCLTVTDYASTERTRITSTRQALQIAANVNHPDGATSGGPILWGATRLQTVMPVIYERGQTDHWIPDWSTIRASAKQDDMAEVECWVREVRPWAKADGWDLVEKPDGDMSTDPRKLLEAIQTKAADKGIDFKVGYEIEFILLPSPTASETITTPTTLYSSVAIREKSFQVILDAARHLEANGVGVWNYHHELGGKGTGKFELSLAPLPPSEAADALLYSMRTIKDVAHRHGYFATMHPHPLEVGPTAGQHIHFSVSNPDLAPSFLAGVLGRLEQLMTFFLSGYDSYSRDRSFMYGGGYVYWSLDKLAPIREVSAGHWEFRMPDTFCSPHLQLAALISAGVQGIEDKMELTIKPAQGMDVKKMTDEQRAKAGIRTGPRSLTDAIACLEKDKEWWSDNLSVNCVEGFLANRKFEDEKAPEMTYKQRTDVIHYGPPIGSSGDM